MSKERKHRESITDRIKSDRPNVTERLSRDRALVSDRLADRRPPITECLEKNGVRRQDFQSRFGPDLGDVIADRYLVQKGPLVERTGEALVFQGQDQVTNELVAVKVYKTDFAPKEEVLEDLLNVEHPNVVALKDYGLWAGHFFEVMEFCKGGTLADFMPYPEEDLKGYLRGILDGLKYCHDQGIIHRDIKPSNLFFRDPDRYEVVLADFGISSHLPEGEEVRITNTISFLTPDYAAPELLLKGEVSSRTDFYALGITLLHLLCGRSPFAGITDLDKIRELHYGSKVPIPKDVSNEFLRLIKGLLRVRRDDRWGYRQALLWLKGETVLTDEGRPDREDIYAARARAYPRCPEATTPVELAHHLDRFDAERELFRGNISDWIRRFFGGEDLARRVEEIEENYDGKRRGLGLFKLRYTLDPGLPLEIGGHVIRRIPDLIELLKKPDGALASALEEAIWGEFLDCWLETTVDDPGAKELVNKIKAIRVRLKDKNPELALFSLLYTLDPAYPFKIADGLAITRPEELEHCLGNRPDLIPAVQRLLFDGLFEEWIIACFPEKAQEEGEFLCWCRNSFQDAKDLGTYALRWHYCPSLAFPFGNESAKEPSDLARLIDRTPAGWDQGIEYLFKGWIRTWLFSTGRLKDPRDFDAILTRTDMSRRHKMEEVLHLLDKDLPRPEVTADLRKVDLGKIASGASKSADVWFRNKGRGHLAGGVRLEHMGEKGFSLQAQALEGHPARVRVTANPLGLPAGSRQQALLVAETNAGRVEVPVTYRVAAPLGGMILRSILAGLICGAILGLLRWFMDATMPNNWHHLVFDWYSLTFLWNHGTDFLILFVWFVLVYGAIACGVYYLMRMDKALRKE